MHDPSKTRPYVPTDGIDPHDLVNMELSAPQIIALLVRRVEILQCENHDLRIQNAQHFSARKPAAWVEGTENGQRIMIYDGHMIDLGVIPKSD